MIDTRSPSKDYPIRSEFADDPDFADLLQLFADSIPEKVQSLRAWHQLKNTPELCVQAHQLKGAGGGYGFPALSTAAADLELACKSRDEKRIAASLDVLLDFLHCVKV